MDYRSLLVTAALATGLSSVAPSSRADIIATDSGVSVKESDQAAPRRGMTMEQVASKFGAPVSKVAAVGKPPISRWEYPRFVVYFEHDHVIHSVVASSTASDAPPASGSAPPTSSDSAPSTDPAPSADTPPSATSSN
jgi:hypothetical protein